MANTMKINLTNYKDRVGARVPEGTYRVVVDDVEQSESRNGNPMVNTWLRILGGEQDGAVIVDRLTFSEKSLFRVVGFMQAIGQKTPRKEFSINLDTWINRALDVEVADGEPYNGRIKSEVRAYLKPSKKAASSTSEAEELPVAPTQDVKEDLPDHTEEAPKPSQVEPEPETNDSEVPDEIDVDEVDLG